MIAAAVVFFVLFVSAQALRDWPIGDLHIGGSDDSAAVSPAQSLGGGGSASPAATNLNGPITGTVGKGAPATKAGGGNNNASGRPQGDAKVSPETRIQGGRGVDSAPVQQPSSTTPPPAPSPGTSSPSPGGSGTASPPPSSSGGGNSTAGGGGQSGGSAGSGNVGTRTARRVTNTVDEIASAATPPAPSPVTNAVGAVEERASQSPPPSGSTVDKVGQAIAGIGD